MEGGQFGDRAGTQTEEWDCSPLIDWDTGARGEPAVREEH